MKPHQRGERTILDKRRTCSLSRAPRRRADLLRQIHGVDIDEALLQELGTEICVIVVRDREAALQALVAASGFSVDGSLGSEEVDDDESGSGLEQAKHLADEASAMRGVTRRLDRVCTVEELEEAGARIIGVNPSNAIDDVRFARMLGGKCKTLRREVNTAERPLRTLASKVGYRPPNSTTEIENRRRTAGHQLKAIRDMRVQTQLGVFRVYFRDIVNSVVDRA